MEEDWKDMHHMPIQQTHCHWDSIYTLNQSASTETHSPNSFMAELENIQGIMDSRWETFLDALTPFQETLLMNLQLDN